MRWQWIVFIFLAVLAAVLVRIAPRPATTPPDWTVALFPARVGAFQRTRVEGPGTGRRREMMARYWNPQSRQRAEIDLSLGRNWLHDWIGCFLVQGPAIVNQPALRLPVAGGPADVQLAYLHEPRGLRLVGHAECHAGRWRAGDWRTRWRELWEAPGTTIPLLNLYVAPPDHGGVASEAGDEGFVRQQNWRQLVQVCRAVR